jgi:DNA-binding transcriptional LysR family regulator
MLGSFVLYEAFVAVCEGKSYNEVARGAKDGESDSVSRLQTHIKKLENLLGVKLIVSDKKGSRPTPDGERLYPIVKELLRQFKDLEKGYDPFTENSPFSIRIVIPSVFSIAQFSKFIGSFRSEYINADIEFLTADCVETLRAKKADFAISLKSNLLNNGFVVKDLYEDELVILHNEDIVLATEENVEIIEYNESHEDNKDDENNGGDKKKKEVKVVQHFRNLDFVVSDDMNNIFYQRTGFEIKANLKVDTTEQIYSMVKWGVAGCGLYWKSAIDKGILEAGKLEASKIDEIEHLSGDVIIACAYNKGLSNGQRAFLDSLLKHCKKLPQPVVFFKNKPLKKE